LKMSICGGFDVSGTINGQKGRPGHMDKGPGNLSSFLAQPQRSWENLGMRWKPVWKRFVDGGTFKLCSNLYSHFLDCCWKLCDGILWYCKQ
jgi:hypothetical protein